VLQQVGEVGVFRRVGDFRTRLQCGETRRPVALRPRRLHDLPRFGDKLQPRLPFGVGLQISRGFLHTPIGRRMADLLPTTPPEVRRIHDHDGPATDYAGITADVLLAAGSGSPTYFAENCQAVADAIPRGRAIVIPRASHNAANVARDSFVTPFATFFAGTLATA